MSYPEFTPEELGAEEWLPIPGFTRYDVSSLGRVRSRKRLPARILTPNTSGIGYAMFDLCEAGAVYRRTGHSLVLEAFVGPRPSADHDARHFPDDSRSNNRLSNLSWSTKSTNMMDKHFHRTMPTGERHGRAKLSDEERSSIAACPCDGVSRSELAKRFGVHRKTIARIQRRLNGKSCP